MSRTLRARLATVTALVFAALFAGVSEVSYRLLRSSLDADATLRLTELTDGLRGYLRFGDVPQVAFDARDREVAAFVHDATLYFQAYDATTGRLLAQSDGARTLGLTSSPDEVRNLRRKPRSIVVDTRRGRVRLSNSVIATAGRVYLVQVGVSLAAIDTVLRRYRDLLLWSVAPVLVAAGLAAWGVAAVALAPLVRVADAARSIDIRSLGVRLPVPGTDDELDDVVLAFNDTLDRLRHAVDEMRQFAAALAHELRTPLAVLRGEIELALRRSERDRPERQTFASQLEEIDRLKRLIEQILTLARAEAGQIPIESSPVNLGALASSLVEQLQPVAETRDISLECERHGDVVVEGDAGWLERLLLNLLDNALKFTLSGGRVVVSVSRCRAGARIAVRDTGVGMSPEDARRAFERFFRVDPARSSSTQGAGLGLSLAQWIVHSHHGTITVDSGLGVGSTFTVTLPAVARVHRAPVPDAHRATA